MASEQKQQEVIALMREVLGENYTNLWVTRAKIEEDLEKGTTAIECEVLFDKNKGEASTISGKGVGVVDAFFRAVQTRFVSDYPSLKTIRFQSFSVDAQLDTKKDFAGTDSQATITIEIANSEGKIFCFNHTSRSVIRAALITTLHGLEYFINSERAFVAIHHARKDAEERKRSDLVQRYTGSLATLVQNTSYSDVLSKIKEELG